MKKTSLLLVPVLAAVCAIPAFCAADMNKNKLEDSIRDCRYFKTSSFINRDNESVKYVEKIQGYVNGKCRYITEFHYKSGKAEGKICDLDNDQRMALYRAKMNTNTNTNDMIYVRCESYNLVNNNWVKNDKGATLGIRR